MNKTLLFTLIGAAVVGTGGYFAYKALQGGDKHLRMIPGNAAVVVTFDFKSLADKAEFNGKFKETKVYKAMMKASEENKHDSMGKIFSDIMKNPLSCGINVFSKMYFYVSKDSLAGSYTAIVADMKDESDFENSLEKFPEFKGKTKSAKDYKYLSINRNKIFLVWNSTAVVLINMPYEYRYSEDESIKPEMLVNKIMGLEKSKSMAANSAFKEWNSKQHDISAFISYSDMAGMDRGMAMYNPFFQSVMKNYQGIYVGAGMSFENNRISFTSKTFGDVKKINYMKSKGVSDKALQSVTNDKVLAMASMSLDIPKILSVFGNKEDMDRNMNQAAQNLGLNNGDELKSVFNGEITLALVDFAAVSDTVMDYDYDPVTGMYQDVQRVKSSVQPALTVNLGIGNKDNYNKLMTKIPGEQSEGIRTTPLPIPMMSNMMMHIVENDYGVMITNNLPIAQTMARNKKLDKKPESGLCSMATDKPTAFFWDLNLNNYPQALATNMKSEMGDKGFDIFKNYMSIFKDLRGSGDMSGSQIDINLVDGDGNALYRLFKQMDYLPIDDEGRNM